MEESEKRIQDYVKFIRSLKERFSKIGNLIRGNTVSPHAVNLALSQYYDMNLELMEIYEEQKIKHLEAENDFQAWYDSKFQECRQEVIELYEEVRNVKPAVKEYDIHLRTKYAEEYRRRKAEVDTADSRVNYLRKMFDIMKKYDNILTTLSYNMRTEMKALSLEDRANADPVNNSNNRIRESFPSREEVPERPSDI